MARFVEFKRMMKKAKVGQHIQYHYGLLIDDRQGDDQLDLIARFCLALFTINVARIYQKRDGDGTGYYVVLTKKLKVRADQSGTFQDAERLV